MSTQKQSKPGNSRWMFSSTCFICFALAVFSANGFIFTRDTDLHFGELVITSNASISSTTLTRQGRVSNTGSIFIITQGTPGEYTLSGLTPFTSANLSVTLPVESVASFPGTQQLTLATIDMPGVVTANNAGIASFKIGGTIQTSGLGGVYANPANYPFFIDLEITL